MATVLTHLYLRPAQRAFLHGRAKVNGTNASAEARSAIDLYKATLSLGELGLLELATHGTKGDLDAINATLDAGLRRADVFFAQVESLRAGVAR